MVLGDPGDHLLDQHGLADAGAAEQADLAALDVRRQQVDDLDAGLEHLGLRLELVERRRLAVDAPALLDLELLALLEVEAVAGGVEHLAEGRRRRPARVIGPPVSVTCAPRTRPSVGCSEMARTMPSPMCWATSRVIVCVSPPRVELDLELVVDLRHRVRRELDVDDRADDAGDPADAAARLGSRWSLQFSGSHVSHSHSLAGGRVGQRVDATDDLADFLGDAGLAGLVGDSGVLLDELVGVVGRGLHRLLPGGELGGGRLQQGEVDPALDVLRQQRVEHLGRRRLELVERQHVGSCSGPSCPRRPPGAAAGRRSAPGPASTGTACRPRAPRRRPAAPVLGLDSPSSSARNASISVWPISWRHVVGRLVGEPGPGLDDRALAELEVRLALAAGDVGRRPPCPPRAASRPGARPP